MSVQNQQSKVAVSVSEMAKMVGLSRARFYQLQKAGAFPGPSYDLQTRRPFYHEQQQAVCLDVRRRNCGIDGKPILFYSRRVEIRPTPPRSSRITEPKTRPLATVEHAELLEALQSLGMASATTAQVKSAMAELFPQGTAGVDQGEVIRAIFITLKRQNSADNLR